MEFFKMATFFNIAGSTLLILAGISVFFSFLTETPQIPKHKKINFENWIWIGLLALAARWLIYVVSYWIDGNSPSFWELIQNVFAISGDSPHYLYLAEHGYTAIGEKANLIVFYPLYPFLMKIFNVVFRNYFVSGIVVSNLAFALAACMFYELLRLDFDNEHSISGLVLMIVAPFSMFYSAIFTESVFVLCTVLCLYFMRTKKTLWMAIFGFLACLSRTQGVILFVCALIPVASDLIKKKKFNIKELIGAFIIPLGFLIYLLMNKVLFDNWFQYLEFQAAPPWYNTAQWFGKTLSYSYDMGLAYPGLSKFIYWPQLALFFIGTLAIFFGIYKKVRTEYLVYLGAYIFTCYTHGWLISGSRYMCACLPLYIIFASTKNKYVRYSFIVISIVLCLCYTNWWLQGQSIM